MLGALQNPYVFAVVLAFVTAILTFLLSTVTDKDSTRSKRAFFTTMAAGLLAGVVLTYFTSSRAGGAEAALATEPFDTIAGATTVPVGI